MTDAESAAMGGDQSARLLEEFQRAVEMVGTSRLGAMLPEPTQRRLYGLHTCATRGAAPQSLPAGMADEQWQAWREVSATTNADAMEEYLTTVELESLNIHDDEHPEGAAGGGVDDLPPGLREQLAAAGLFPAVSPSAAAADDAADIFEAARSGGAAVRPAKRGRQTPHAPHTAYAGAGGLTYAPKPPFAWARAIACTDPVAIATFADGSHPPHAHSTPPHSRRTLRTKPR
jgi:hypothetical protein